MTRYTKTWTKAWLLCALLAACGDDGSERLSSCPDARIETDKMGIIRCARPRAGTGGGAAAKPDGTAGKPTATTQANRASSPAQTGAAPATPAASGGSSAAPSGGELPSGGNWYCLQVMNACSCVMGSIDSDTCDKPRPTCCVSVKNDSSVATCVCYPADSAECMGVKADPTNYPPVAQCPPK